MYTSSSYNFFLEFGRLNMQKGLQCYSRVMQERKFVNEIVNLMTENTP